MATAFLEAVKDAKEWFILWDELNLVEAHLAYRDGIYVKIWDTSARITRK